MKLSFMPKQVRSTSAMPGKKRPFVNLRVTTAVTKSGDVRSSHRSLSQHGPQGSRAALEQELSLAGALCLNDARLLFRGVASFALLLSFLRVSVHDPGSSAHITWDTFMTQVAQACFREIAFLFTRMLTTSTRNEKPMAK